jgi:hypothetical protein
MIVYPKAFREKVRTEQKEVQREEESREKVEIWKKFVAEDWNLAVANFNITSWMDHFKKIPASLDRLAELVPQLEKEGTVDVFEMELRTSLDYVRKSLDMMTTARDKIDDILQALWKKKGILNNVGS